MGRGHYGAGSIFQRGPKGIWYYQGFVNGKRIGPFSTGSTDRQVAQRQLDKLRGKRAHGEITGTRRDHITVVDLLREYLAYADDQLKSARVIRWAVEAHLLEHPIASLRAQTLTTEHLRSYRADRQAEDADDTTINREIGYLRAAFRRTQKEGRLAHVPYFPTTKEDNARQGFLTEARFLDLLTHFERPLKPFACCANYGGLRRGELLNLDLADVDLERFYLEVRRSKNDDPRLVPILEGPMEEWLTWALENARAGQSKLFVWEDGRPFTRYDFYASWNAACARAGEAGLTLHDLRRSANRNMRNDGVPQSLRMKIMGQRTPSMDRRYGIVDFEDVEQVRILRNAKRRTKLQAAAAKMDTKTAARRSPRSA